MDVVIAVLAIPISWGLALGMALYASGALDRLPWRRRPRRGDNADEEV